MKLNLKWVADSIGDDYKNWRKGDTVLISAQTGTGKTWFVKNVLIDNMSENERLLFVCNRTNLKRQLKKDLLQKFNNSILETVEELDEITTIDNVTVTSYHAISNTIKDTIYNSDAKECDFSFYDYIILDESHFIIADGGFNNKTRFAYTKLIQEWQPNAIKVFISATMQEIRQPILNCIEKTKTSGFGLDRFEVHEYSTGNDYSYVNSKYFKKIDSVINLIKNDRTDDKWLIFISNIDRDGKKILEAIGEDNCSIIQAGTQNEELASIINNSQFNKKVLVSTKAMDNGINIEDPLLKNIVIMTWERISFIQMLGRKRINIENAQKVNLYIPTRFKKSFSSKLKGYNAKKKEINLLSDDKVKFYQKYDNDLKDFKGFNDVFYRDYITKEIKINPIGNKRLEEDMKFAAYMVRAFKGDEFAFVKEQLSWLGLSETFSEENLLGDVLVESEIETLDKYLEGLIGIELHKKEQKQLKQFITADFDNMISKLQKGHSNRDPGLKILNKLISVCDIPYIVKSYSVRKRVNKKIKSITYWKVEKVEEIIKV